jgi:phosphoribosylaminoimidazole-succinocarboxamide synthase
LQESIHTPDTSPYYQADGYQERQEKGEEQKQLSKEFVRRWLIENGFQGQDGQQIPDMTDAYIESVSERYIELFENILGEKFVKADIANIDERIEKNVVEYLSSKK